MTEAERLYQVLLPMFRDNLQLNNQETRKLILDAISEAFQLQYEQGRESGLDEGRAPDNDIRFFVP
jgi:hypothetical protein